MHSRLRRSLWIIGSLVALYAIAGFFVLPPIVRSQLQKQGSAALGRTVTVERVKLNPFALSVTIDGLDVRTADGRGSFLGWTRFYANFEALASVTGSWVLGDVSLQGFHADVAVNPDGTLNVSDILAKFRAPASAAPVPAAPEKPARPLLVRRLQVAGARVEFTDASRHTPFRTTVGPMDFSLEEFRTAAGPDAPYRFSAVTESGEKLDWSGTLNAVPLASKGAWRIENLQLPKYAPYFDTLLRGRLASGRLAVSGHYDVRLDGDQRRLRLTEGAAKLEAVCLLEADGQPAVELPSLSVTGIEADGVARKATIARVELAGGHVAVRREKDGTLNLLALLAPPATPPASGTPAAAPAAPVATPAAPVSQMEIGEIAVDRLAIDIRDLAGPTPATLSLAAVRARISHLTLAPGAKLPVELSFDWAPRGTVKLAGEVSLQPFVADLQVDVAALALPPLTPYLEQAMNARVTQGAVSVTGRVDVALPPAGAPAIAFAGDVSIDGFGLVDGVRTEELAGFARLAVSGIKISTTPRPAASVAEIRLTAPYARAVIGPDQRLNFAAVFGVASALAVVATPVPPAPASAAAEPSVATSPAPRTEISVARIVVDRGDFSFTDRSVQPEVHVTVKEFDTTLSDWSSLQPGRGQAEVRAKIGGSGPLAVDGKFDPLAADPQADLKLAVRAVDLQPVSPYLGRYAGYELARGQLYVDVTAKLADRKLDLQNVVTLDQFTFGRPTNSPDATHLPVRLGVALLKDTQGKIVIDIPVAGSLDDPEFKVGRVVVRVIVNLLTKAAVSPFSLIGSMFGGGGDELGQQEFLPGETALTPESRQRLATVQRALAARPGLNLDIAGGYDEAADRHALQHARATQAVRQRVWLDRRALNPDLPPPDKLEIAGDEFAAALKKLFDEKFPPGTQFGTPLPAAPALQPPVRTEHRGFFRRAIDVVTFKAAREKRALKKLEEEARKQHETQVAAAIAAGLPADEMLGRLAQAVDITTDDLRALAEARAERIREILLTDGHIAAGRLFLTQPEGDQPGRLGARAELHLQ
jgi:hypothetical protein